MAGHLDHPLGWQIAGGGPSHRGHVRTLGPPHRTQHVPPLRHPPSAHIHGHGKTCYSHGGYDLGLLGILHLQALAALHKGHEQRRTCFPCGGVPPPPVSTPLGDDTHPAPCYKKPIPQQRHRQQHTPRCWTQPTGCQQACTPDNIPHQKEMAITQLDAPPSTNRGRSRMVNASRMDTHAPQPLAGKLHK